MKEAGHILPVVFIIFWLYHVAHRTIGPPPETEPMPPVLEQGVLTTRPPGKSLSVFFAHISGFTFDLSPFDRDLGFLGSSAGKESGCNAGDLGSIPGLGRSPGEENSYPLQYSGLENAMDCIAHGVAKSWTGLSDFYFHLSESVSPVSL